MGMTEPHENSALPTQTSEAIDLGYAFKVCTSNHVFISLVRFHTIFIRQIASNEFAELSVSAFYMLFTTKTTHYILGKGDDRYEAWS